jgi:hypothetical protein
VTAQVSHQSLWEGKPRDRMEGYLRLLGENLDLSAPSEIAFGSSLNAIGRHGRDLAGSCPAV